MNKISRKTKYHRVANFEEKQMYHVTVHVGLRNLVGVFETTVQRCRANDNHACFVTSPVYEDVFETPD